MEKLARWAALWATILASTFAAATAQTTDLLGAHNCYGRGCLACHVPHSGEGGNGTASGGSSQPAWGQSLTPLYGKTLSFGDTSSPATVTLPSSINGFAGATDPNFLIIACLSCHDGNLAKPGLMKGISVETLPVTGGHAPTLLANDGTVPGNYNNDHPIGPTARFACGGANNWDCAISSVGTVSMTGRYSSQFARNYGFTVSLSTTSSNVPIVVCTTCHDQHSEDVWSGSIGGVQANWKTTFFVRGPYTPNASTSGNAASQFCRNCHAAQSNEMHGLTNVPTTGIAHL